MEFVFSFSVFKLIGTDFWTSRKESNCSLISIVHLTVEQNVKKKEWEKDWKKERKKEKWKNERERKKERKKKWKMKKWKR